MKKGLLLALLTVALVAVVVPAGARAPILTLPDVIMGDSEDVAGTGTEALHLMRYLNAVNLASPSVTETFNGNPLSDLHFYYVDDAGDDTETAVGVSASEAGGLAGELTAAEATALLDTGTEPAASKEISDSATTFYWLSLINSTIHPSITDVYGATAAADGETQLNYPAGSTGEANPVVLTVYAHDGDFSEATTGSDTMEVYSLVDASDSYSPLATPVYFADFEGDTDNWVQAGTGGSGFDTVTFTSTATGIGFTCVNNNTQIGYGTWSSGNGTSAAAVIDVSQAAFAGQLLKGRWQMGSTAATAAATPAYRLLFANGAFTHLGGIFIQSTDSAPGGINTPSAGNDVNTLTYWEVPFNLNGMGDTDFLATQTPDLRDYILIFDVIDVEATDAGVLTLEEMEVTASAMPTGGTTIQHWGGTGTAFTADWLVGGSVPGFTDGTRAVNAANMTLAVPTGTTAFAQVGMAANATNQIPWESDKLLKVTASVATSSVNATPDFRFIYNVVNTAGSPLPILFGAAYGYGTVQNVYAPGTLAGTPGTTATPMVNWIWTHTATTAGIAVQIDAYRGATPPNGWPNSTATLTVSDVLVEEM